MSSSAKPPASGAPFNAVEEVIFRRRSVRVYRKRQVPAYLVRRVIEAGRFAPSAGNAMPWKFIVVRDAAMIEEMTSDCIEVCKKLSKLDYTREGRRGRGRITRMLQRMMPNDLHPVPLRAMWEIAEGRFGVWHGAPTVIIILVDTRAPGKCLIDVGITGQNMVLAAHSLGLGTCWVGFVELLNRKPRWKERLGIRKPYIIGNSLALGFPRGSPDGYVPRETHAIDWYAGDGSFRQEY